MIDCRWFGTHGGARFANVNGSFYDFVAERFDGTHTTRLVDPPDEWGGRALIKWITDLSRNGAHDPARGTELVELARIIDRSYGRSAPVRTA